ncbi:hypothetical protein ACN2MM_10210 [Alkalilimnicola ehrlichii MLHE-1]|uniref:Uncharacterized protein n=1 Tax=Alkalilimnicola ehrlichii (strain ATCC BAA-1101 / DSM 17681 / MLHE-1) TaxID=187272 RepID=Q0A7F0_ALKEH|nr:hypothetical protein [Alkalilimnicola ehrlichii]ABI57237.1 hypothetical protein Mlg_1893 [Alkalilimnicola ehrlichii MLHE-1]
MSRWNCYIKPGAMEDARASLGELAEETFTVEAEDQIQALAEVKAQLSERYNMSTLPADLLDDWLVIQPAPRR